MNHWKSKYKKVEDIGKGLAMVSRGVSCLFRKKMLHLSVRYPRNKRLSHQGEYYGIGKTNYSRGFGSFG